MPPFLGNLDSCALRSAMPAISSTIEVARRIPANDPPMPRNVKLRTYEVSNKSDQTLEKNESLPPHEKSYDRNFSIRDSISSAVMVCTVDFINAMLHEAYIGGVLGGNAALTMGLGNFANGSRCSFFNLALMDSKNEGLEAIAALER